MAIRTNKSTKVHQGRIFDIFKENITLDNGITINLDIIRHPGASAIVPAFKNDSLILIKQYRHAIGDYIWEIPAGTFNTDEDPLECAKRELTEETGYSANIWEKLGEITPVPGYSDERIHIFFAADLVRAEQKLDEDEVLEVHEVKVPEALDMIRTGVIQDSKTISGLFMATLWMKNRVQAGMK